jgi:hypothetical protein
LTRSSSCGSCCVSDNKRFAAASGVIIVQRWLVVVGCAAIWLSKKSSADTTHFHLMGTKLAF